MHTPKAAPLFTFLIALMTASLFASDKTFPQGVVVDVTQAPYSMDNTGKEDVTATLQRAIQENRGLDRPTTLYFPKGTYLVSDTLRTLLPNERREEMSFLTFQGENEAETVIKLKDNAPGFSKAEVSKPVLNAACPTPKGDSFKSNFFDLTVDVGSGNPGAVGISFRVKPQGALCNLTIRSSDAKHLGRCGLSVRAPREPASVFIKNLTVEGFDYGVQLAPRDYSVVIEQVTLRNQRKAGIENRQNVCSIHGLRSENTCPAVINGSKEGVMTLIDVEALGGNAEASVVNKGDLFVRNLKSSGYRSAVLDKMRPHSERNIKEACFGASLALFKSSDHTLGLPIKSTPEVVWDAPKNWVSVASFGATPNDGNDDSAAIQAAIDSMEKDQCTLYFPNGVWTVKKTLTLRGNVRRVFGNFAQIEFLEPELGAQASLFRVENTKHPVLLIERLLVNTSLENEASVPQGYLFENHRTQLLVLKHILGVSQGLYFGATPGEVFMEHVVSSSPLTGVNRVPACYFYPGEQVWARYFSAESDFTSLVNTGASVWILGYNVHKVGVQFETQEKGRTEIVGSFLRSSTLTEEPDVPTFAVEDASLSVVGAKVFMQGKSDEATFFMREMRGDQSRDLVLKEVHSQGAQSSFALPMMVASGTEES